MNTATRYAKALMQSAKSLPQEEQEQLYVDMHTLRGYLCEMSDLKQVLSSPTEPAEHKRQLLLTAGGIKNSAIYEKFVDLVISHHREALLPFITHIFVDLYRQAEGITAVLIETAAPLQPDTQAKLEKKIAELLQTTPECTYRVRPELIGGFRIRVDDKRIDATYARRLEDIRKEILWQNN